MAIAKILDIRPTSAARPEARVAQSGYQGLMNTSVGRLRVSQRIDHHAPGVYRDRLFVRAYVGMPLKLNDCLYAPPSFAMSFACGTSNTDLGGGRWALIRGAGDVAVMDEFPLTDHTGERHAGPLVEDVSFSRPGMRSTNPPNP